MVKWYSQDVEPKESKNIVIRILNDKSIIYCGDYTHNRNKEWIDLDWKKFTSHILLVRHSKFEWCYWEDVEKMLNKDLK